MIWSKLKHDTIKYEFSHDEYIDLRTPEFDRITIRICDVTGKVLQTHDNLLDARLQLEFWESTQETQVHSRQWQ